MSMSDYSCAQTSRLHFAIDFLNVQRLQLIQAPPSKRAAYVSFKQASVTVCRPPRDAWACCRLKPLVQIVIDSESGRLNKNALVLIAQSAVKILLRVL